MARSDSRKTTITGVPGALTRLQNRPASATEEAEEPAHDLDRLPDSTSSDEDIAGVLSELGEDAADSVVKIFRITAANPRGVYIYEMSPAEFSLKNVSDSYGGGKFLFVVLVPQVDDTGRKTGRKVFAKRMVAEIDGLPKVPKREDAPVAAPADHLANVMMQGFQKLGELIIAAKPAPVSRREMLEEMQLYKNLFAPAVPAAPAADPFAQLESVLSIADRLRPPGGDGDSGAMLGLVRELGAMWKASLNAKPGAAQLPAPSAPLPATPTDAAPAPVAAPEAETLPEDPVMLQKAMERMAVNELLSQAEANSDVVQLAAQLHPQLNDDFMGRIAREDYLDELALVNPRVKLFKVWFDKLRAEVLRLESDPQRPVAL